MPQAKIRKLTIEDYEAIIKLWKHAELPYKPKGRDSRAIMEKQMKEFPEFFLGAFDKDRLVGVVIGSYENRMKGWINRLAVDPNYQRQGVAQQLVRKMEKALEKHGAAIFAALIEMPNENSVGLFQKTGYKAHREILYVSKRKSKEV